MSKVNLQGQGTQYIMLLAIAVGWIFSLVEFYANHVISAQPIADGGWAALLTAWNAGLAPKPAPTTPPPAA